MFAHHAAAWEVQGISPATKLVLLYLADMAGMDSRCWPSCAYLARKIGLTERCVRAALKALEEGGLIRREKRFREDGSNTSDMITLLVGAPEIEDDPPLNSDAEGGENRSGLTLFEPTRESTKEPKGAASRRKPERPIPDGFPADAERRDALQMAAERKVIIDVEREAERFRNYSLAHDRRWRDWRAAWRNWISRALEGAPTATAPGAPTGDVPVERQRAWMRDWLDNPMQWKTHIRGPAPDQPGCRISAPVMSEFGRTPVAPKSLL